MSRLCSQCSIEAYDTDSKDFFAPYAEAERVAFCDGCGLVVVNIKGECISPACTKQHGESA